MAEVIATDNPEQEISLALEQLQLSGLSNGNPVNTLLCLRYTFEQYYLPNNPLQNVLIVIHLSLEHPSTSHNRLVEQKTVIRMAIGLDSPRLEDELALLPEDAGFNHLSAMVTNGATDRFKALASLPWVNLTKPLPLDPVYIPKPWGREIWYTGIEERGQAGVLGRTMDGRTASLLLPWLLATMPGYLTAMPGKPITLLKILDPLPEPVFGDLYFEMHERKQEVYVVTHIDRNAWPGGIGGIRFGFNQQKRRSFADDKEFRAAYQQAVAEYEALRRKIDGELDKARVENNVGVNEPLPVEQIKQWLKAIDKESLEQERVLRERMEDFIHTLPLSVGDVVKVPCFTPHSLQHGVRTVEFQTPVYERKILSFGQKVLTQDHWDTEEAMEVVTLDAPTLEPLTPYPFAGADTEATHSDREQETRQAEQVVSFDDFEVFRLSLGGGDKGHWPCSRYALVMSLVGEVQVNGELVGPGQAVLIAAAEESCVFYNPGRDMARVVLSLPKGSAM